MDTTKILRDELPDPDETFLDAEIWLKDSHELHGMAETLVKRHPRSAWMVVDAWLSKHGQTVVSKT